MKLFVTFSFFFLSILGTTFAQVYEQSKTMSQGTRSAIVIDIPNTDEKLVGKIWQSFTKDFYDSKTKWNRKTDEWVTAEADIVSLGMGNDVNLYTTAEKSGDGVIFTMWTDLGDSFLSAKDNPERYREAEKLLMRFALEVAKEEVKFELKDEEKNLKDFSSDLKKLQNEKERYEKDIEKAKEAIVKAEEAIEKNIQDQEDMVKKIELQEQQVEVVRKKLNDL
ncbi:MAG: hypothetical protein DHS20C18_41460 [Saprospiraceae bacterium]|nr:MAG: hypothetical protein DHS20C18_41460 [Saprospiraceae bacterium]